MTFHPPSGDHHNHSESETPEQSFINNHNVTDAEAAGGEDAGAEGAGTPPKTNMVSLADFDLIKVSVYFSIVFFRKRR